MLPNTEYQIKVKSKITKFPRFLKFYLFITYLRERFITS